VRDPSVAAERAHPDDLPVWIRTPGALTALAVRLRAAGELALDTEGDSLHHYPERLALMQVAIRTGHAWLIDPLAIADLTPLLDVLADPGMLTVLHAGDNDLAQLKRRHAARVAGVFDTSIAARYLGVRALGLDVLLEQYLGVTLPPSRQRDDWSARPLSESQEAYALADVRHLFALKDRLADELQVAGRLAWVEEECAALAALVVTDRPPDPDAYARLKGARELTPRGLAIVRALVLLRERLARAADRPPFKVFADDLIVRLAANPPADTAALLGMAGATPRLVARWGLEILTAIEAAQSGPDEELPRLERRPIPRVPRDVTRRTEALRRWREGAAIRFGLDAGVLLPNRLIQAIAEAGPTSTTALASVDGIRRWRVEAFGSELVASMIAP
jgi:ribonuclease D